MRDQSHCLLQLATLIGDLCHTPPAMALTFCNIAEKLIDAACVTAWKLAATYV